MHYQRWANCGDPGEAARRTPPKGTSYRTFLELTAIETDDCVLWPLSKSSSGYGRLLLPGNKEKSQAHRAALALRVPCPDEQMLACHRPGIGCHRACINYRHLYWGTAADNNGPDRLIDGTHFRGRSNVRTAEDVLEIRRLNREGVRHAVIAERFGSTVNAINGVLYGRSWKWLP